MYLFPCPCCLFLNLVYPLMCTERPFSRNTSASEDIFCTQVGQDSWYGESRKALHHLQTTKNYPGVQSLKETTWSCSTFYPNHLNESVAMTAFYPKHVNAASLPHTITAKSRRACAPVIDPFSDLKNPHEPSPLLLKQVTTRNMVYFSS